MKNLFEAASQAEVKARVQRLRPDSEREWGKMSVAQAVAHCAASMETALGETHRPRVHPHSFCGPADA